MPVNYLGIIMRISHSFLKSFFGELVRIYVRPVLSKYENSVTKMQTQYKIYPRSKVEKLVTDFIEEHKIYAEYGTDNQGVFEVRFIVEED